MARTKFKTELFSKHPLAKVMFDVKNVCVLVVLRRSDSDLPAAHLEFCIASAEHL